VNLALEAISPFPLEQMLVGFVTSADGKQVLAYAAHRRRFTAEESFAWPEDCQVVPEFLALCGHRPAADGIVVHRSNERLTALAWKAGDELPAACRRLQPRDPPQTGAEQQQQKDHEPRHVARDARRTQAVERREIRVVGRIERGVARGCCHW
jgi:hypothetical protein